MLEVLNQFVCDECGTVIRIPQEGLVEWLHIPDEHGKEHASGFRIIHTGEASPWKCKEGKYYGCSKYNKHPGRKDMPLHHVLSVANAFVLHFLNPGYFYYITQEHPYDCSQIDNYYEFTDFACRITIPYYEEARFYFDRWIADGHVDVRAPYYDYQDEFLIHLIETYGKSADTDESEIETK